MLWDSPWVPRLGERSGCRRDWEAVRRLAGEQQQRRAKLWAETGMLWGACAGCGLPT